jgi:tetratricopeptide (TPR) repeat protein
LFALATAALLWRNHPAGFLGTAVFAILSPTLLVPLPTEIAAERRMYLALAPIVALVVVGGYDCVVKLGRRTRNAPDFTANWPFMVRSFAVAVVVMAAVFAAVSLRRIRDYDNELGLWQQVIRLQPDNYLGHLNTGAELFNAGNINEAMKHYRESCRLKPDSSQVHYNIGLAHIKLNEPLEAAKEFAHAVRLQPGSSRLLNNLGVALYMAGKNDESIQVFQKAIEVEPTMWRAHDNLGKSFARAGRFAEAIQCFERALQIDPKILDIYAHLADSQARSHQPAAAIATVEKALQLARDTGDYDTATKIDAQLAAYRASQGRILFGDSGPAFETAPPTN